MNAVLQACETALPEDPTTWVEPLRTGDTVTVQQVFDQLSPQSRSRRFLTAKPRLTGADLRTLVDVDGHDRVALVARNEHGRPIGIARFARDRDDSTIAEVAVTVVDAWQGQGVGTQLARELAERAREAGILRVSVVMAHDNEPAARLMHTVAGDVTRVDWGGGTVDFEVALTETHRRARTVLKGGVR